MREVVEIDDGSICGYQMTDFHKHFCFVQVLHLDLGNRFVNWTERASRGFNYYFCLSFIHDVVASHVSRFEVQRRKGIVNLLLNTSG